MMALWLVRAGRDGEREEFALEHNVAVIGWTELPDLSPAVGNRKKLREMLQQYYPSDHDKRLSNWESQIWPFLSTISKDDLLVLPLKRRPFIAIARVLGQYQ